MKNILTSLVFIFVSITLFAQTDGISYQAVIIGPDTQELPGVDAEGNILPEATIAIRFTILDSNNSVEYKEVQTTNTDAFGRINLLIGSVNPDEFTMISWDGTNKDLKVEIDFSGGGSSFVDMSREQLTFVPYAYHRNITAAGTLKVDDATELNSELLVKGPTNLESILDVSGDTDLNSDLLVKGATWLNDSLNVNKGSSTNLSGSLTVEGKAAFKGETGFNSIEVQTTTSLKGQVTINVVNDTINNDDPVGVGFPGSDDLTNQNDFDKYPLRVEGSYQGMAIKVKEGRGRQNNFISFWDDNKMWGRIEGLTLPQQRHDPEYLSTLAIRTTDVFINTVDAGIAIAESLHAGAEVTASLFSTTPCFGLGACVTAPIFSYIVKDGAGLIMKIANFVSVAGNLVLAIYEEGEFITFKRLNIGVSYQSGAGDYAEWLPKKNPNEQFNAGELVGIKNGLVTKDVWGSEKIMIVSTNPIVLGNMPQQNKEVNSVKIAFMGQVPARVLGKVTPGDYILPNVLGNGFGIAVNPENMKTRDYKRIVGIAWNIIEEITPGLNIVNVAVGINTNDLSEVVAIQEEELNKLHNRYNQIELQMKESNLVLSKLLPGYAEAIEAAEADHVLDHEKSNEKQPQTYTEEQIIEEYGDKVIYFEMSKYQVESIIEIAREQYIELSNNAKHVNKLVASDIHKSVKGAVDIDIMPIENHPFWQKIDRDPEYKEEIILYVQSLMEKSYHTHEKHKEKFTEFKIKE